VRLCDASAGDVPRRLSRDNRCVPHRRRIATPLLVCVLAAACTSRTGGPSRSAQPTSRSDTSSSAGPSPSPTLAVPAWADRCLPKKASDRLGPAPEYIGLTEAAAERLARRRGEGIIVAGAAGRCSNTDELVLWSHAIAVVYERDVKRPPNGPLPRTIRDIAAERVSSYWVPGTWAGGRWRPPSNTRTPLSWCASSYSRATWKTHPSLPALRASRKRPITPLT
jgi:hypothetical protein